MYSVKANVLMVTATLKAYGVKHVVLSPGSRNAPLLHNFAVDQSFSCYSVVDERSAAYFALGLIQKLQEPVAICCTSGTALLNYGPAIAEAFYQELPLVVISADRSPAWIGQMDGQTIPQNNLFPSITKKSVHLPEPCSSEDHWFCQRLLHEAILACKTAPQGPVHINVPLSEPLYEFSAEKLPLVTPLIKMGTTQYALPDLEAEWKKYSKRMVLVGQMPPGHKLAKHLEHISPDAVILAEHLANLPESVHLGNFDKILPSLTDTQKINLAPDLLITCGGHVVSKHLKHFLRQYKPKAHWHVSPADHLVDLFQSLTHTVKTTPQDFFEGLNRQLPKSNTASGYCKLWQEAGKSTSTNPSAQTFTEIAVVEQLLQALPNGSALHLANSSSVRHAQRFAMPTGIDILCNRGTNGIEGAISTAMGYATVHKGLTFLLVGDLSFFYDLNALVMKNIPSTLRILLLNNGGGGIFYSLPGAEQSPALMPYIAAQHHKTAKSWSNAAGLEYLQAANTAELQKKLEEFTCPTSAASILFEVLLTPPATN